MHRLTQVWWRRFVNRTDGTIRRGRDGWVYTPEEVTLEEMDAALQLRQSLGVYAVDQAGKSRWLCLDADTTEGLDLLVRVAGELNPRTTLFELSNRGGHLWWFCPPTPWQTVQAVGRALTRESPLIEVFPKGAGRNGVRLPLTRHPVTNQVYPVVDPTTGARRTPVELETLQTEVLPQLALPAPTTSVGASYRTGPEAYRQLWGAVEQLTRLREYAPERAIGRCPFHDDRRPSLSLLGGFWRCWAGCGEGGINAWRSLARSRGMEVMRDAVHTTQ